MRFLLAMGAAFFAAGTVLAADLPQDVPVTPGKGTIGLVCLDGAGVLHFWSAAEKSEFEACVDQVVRTWSAKNDSTSQACFDELIQGMTTYRQAVDRANADKALERN